MPIRIKVPATSNQETNMSTDFQMTVRHSKDNLHIQTRGTFDGTSAHELLNLLKEHYTGKGRIFVDTNGLQTLHAFGCTVFRSLLHQTSIPVSQLFFKGKNGFSIAPDGSRVLLVSAREKTGKKHVCCGKCANCTCGGHH